MKNEPPEQCEYQIGSAYLPRCKRRPWYMVTFNLTKVTFSVCKQHANKLAQELPNSVTVVAY